MTQIVCPWVRCPHNRNGKCAGQKEIVLKPQEDDDEETHEDCLVCDTYKEPK